jgi:hypothetical protein
MLQKRRYILDQIAQTIIDDFQKLDTETQQQVLTQLQAHITQVHKFDFAQWKQHIAQYGQHIAPGQSVITLLRTLRDGEYV